MGYKRVGECPPERCQGRRCKHLGFWYPIDPQYRELLVTRGVRVGVEGGMMLVDLDQRCEYLTDDNLCALHPDMNPPADAPPRPEVCDLWPTHPSQLVADMYCGFSFVEE